MLIAAAILCGFLLDALLGDPAWLPHPVVLMGKAISALEKRLRSWFPKTPDGEKKAGRVLAVTLPLGTLLISGGLCVGLMLLHPVLGFLLQTFWCWQALAMKGLAVESGNVYRALTTASLPEARKAVARIVGRDTAALTEQGVTRAAVETVAENASDGVVAPLFYMLIGGAPLALTYKAINTMDSMVGYKNERYLHFGRAAAKLDDAANFLPARLAALLWILTCPLADGDQKQAFHVAPTGGSMRPTRPKRNRLVPGIGRSAGRARVLFWQTGGKAVYRRARREIEPWIFAALTMMVVTSLAALGIGYCCAGLAVLFMYAMG
ncbi:MAG: adenosylcobinamide-phosphate synthase CbiB [Acutalibacteraceae bacterium]